MSGKIIVACLILISILGIELSPFHSIFHKVDDNFVLIKIYKSENIITDQLPIIRT